MLRAGADPRRRCRRRSCSSTDYLYFSSFIDALLRHAADNVPRAIAERRLGPNSLVVELASNDGYLLQNFADAGIPCSASTRRPGRRRPHATRASDTRQRFFGSELAAELVAEGQRADVIHRQQRDGARGRHSTASSRASRRCSSRRRRRRDRDPLRAGPHRPRASSTRSTTSTSATSRCTALDSLFRRHGLFLNHVEQLDDPRRLAALVRRARATAASPSVAALLEEERRARARPIRLLRATSRRRVERDPRAPAARCSAASRPGASTHRRLRRRGQGHHPAQLRRASAPSSLDFVVDRNVTSRAADAGRAPADPATRPRSLEHRARLRADPAPGTSRTRSCASRPSMRRRGGQFIVPIPEPMVL